MAQFAAFWTKIASLISTIRIPDIVDILLVAYLIYKLIMLIRKTNSYRVARGLLMILIALWLSGVLKLTMINYLLEKIVELGMIALVILFQPELRRLLERMGGNISSLFGSKRLDHLTTETEITQTIMACSDMSTTHTGALIVFERANALDEQMRSGTIVNADVSAELLKNIFFVKAPLHDGAVIIQNGRIAAAGQYESKPGPWHPPPRRHWHERAFGCCGRDCLGGDREHFGRSGRYAQAPPDAGDF